MATAAALSPGARATARLELEEFFDEELGPRIRRVAYQELLPHPGLVVPLLATVNGSCRGSCCEPDFRCSV